MKLTDIGEFGFIDRFARQYDDLVAGADMGIGDDCALISLGDKEAQVVSTDLLLEDIHFLRGRISPEELGHKSLAINLSDIAAMGAEPLYSFLSIGIPRNTEVEYLDRFMAGYYQLSEKYNTPLMGGDTTGSADRLVINVAVIGKGLKKDLRMRSMAQDGDLVCVTGSLGDSAGGLQVLLNKLEDSPDRKELVRRHHLPEPRIREGRWLARQASVGAMIDISDGIASDLRHILKASGKAARVHLDQIPLSKFLVREAERQDWDILGLSTGGGEDYELLFTLAAESFERLQKEYEEEFGKKIHSIGEIRAGEPEITWFKNSKKKIRKKGGFDHFSP
jgi:thiamine-monophosphate kinase